MILKDHPKILFVRSDRMGDVLLSTYAVQAAQKVIRNSEISFLVRPEFVSLLRPVVTALPRDLASGVWAWTRFFRTQKFDAIVFLNWDRELALAAWLARIPVRIGPVSKPSSRLFLNHGLRQRRSESLRHEAEYSLELAEKLCGQRLAAEPLALLRCNLRRGDVIVIHPGMGGSAPNWPIERYFEVGRELQRRGSKVIYTVGPKDEAVRNFSGPSDTVWGGDIVKLAKLLSEARVVLAPSTGPLHLAVAVGTPVVGLFPKSPPHESERRWGPFLASKRFVFEFPPGDTQSLTADPVIRKIEEFYGSRSFSKIARSEARESPQVL